MNQCPVCGAAAKPSAPECACGESLTAWRTIAASGATLRDRGLALAAGGDFLGASLALVEAALTNPLDSGSLVEAAKALIRLGRYEDAIRWLEATKGTPSADAAAPLIALAEKMNEPTAEAATSARAALPPEQRVPLLGLPAIPRSAGLLSGKKIDKAVAATWNRVAALEADPNRDWQPRGSTLEEVMSDDPHGVYSYMLGLAEWQAGRGNAAATAFQQSVKLDPQVLNPAAYWLALYLGHAGAPQVWAAIRKKYGKDAERLRAILRERFANEGDSERVEHLDTATK